MPGMAVIQPAAPPDMSIPMSFIVASGRLRKGGGTAPVIGGVAAAFLTGTNDIHEMIDFPAKLLVLGLCYVAFLAIFICVSLAASILSRSSASALTLLVGFWIVAGLLVPRLGAYASKLAYPTPSSFEVAAAVESGRDKGPHAHEPNHPNHIAFRDKTLKKYGVTRIEDLPINFIGYALQHDEEIGFKVFDRTYGAVRRDFEEQDKFQQIFSFVSPFIPIKALSAALSGTDVEFSNDFSAAGEAYQRNMVRVLNDDLMKNARGMTNYSAEWGYRANQSLWQRVPAFDFDPPGLARVVERNFLPLAILLLWLLMSVGILEIAARKLRMDR